MGRVRAAALALTLAGGLVSLPSGASAACHSIDVTWYAPTGIAGCARYGAGVASWYHGSGVARNDCTWARRHAGPCQAIAIRSLQTGLVVRVTPVEYCDCFTGTADERLVDLDRTTLAALGLDPADGLYPVEVWPIDASGAPFEPGASLELPPSQVGVVAPSDSAAPAFLLPNTSTGGLQ